MMEGKRYVGLCHLLGIKLKSWRIGKVTKPTHAGWYINRPDSMKVLPECDQSQPVIEAKTACALASKS